MFPVVSVEALKTAMINAVKECNVSIDVMVNSEKILFVGFPRGASLWYRIILPALSIGADWVSMNYDSMVSGYVRGGLQEPNLDDYDVIVLQQPFSEEGYNQIINMREHGQKVIYEIDDFSHGVVMPEAEHNLAEKWSDERLHWTEKCMEASDLVICSTEKLAEKYAKYNDTFICLNGIDHGRYNVEIPERDSINMLWAGGSFGHTKALRPAFKAIGEILVKHDNTKLVTIGDTTFGSEFYSRIPARVMVIPFSFIETYPAAMTNGDIGIAPASDDPFFECKSDLRFLEYAMVGIAGVYHPLIYKDVVDGETGLLASNQEEYAAQLERLVVDEELRKTISKNAREHVLSNRTFPAASESWKNGINKVLDET